ncbi:MAG: hypothetical protein ACFWTQ_01605 [Lactococcus sp.]|jgi:hypothetical protein
MKTLLVGDLHLKMSLVLPIVEEKSNEFNCQRVILLGDYMDAHGQQDNLRLYAFELQFLIDWKQKMQSRGFEIITLVGNHDAPYLIERPEIFSTQNIDLFWAINENLLGLRLQVAYWLDDILVSHAGFCFDEEPKEWYFETITDNEIIDLVDLQEKVGISRGGQAKFGSPLWADYNKDLIPFPNPKYLKQIIGHTPQEKISFKLPMIPIDTFSMGNGELLMYDDESKYLSIIKTSWKSDKNQD